MKVLCLSLSIAAFAIAVIFRPHVVTEWKDALTYVDHRHVECRIHVTYNPFARSDDRCVLMERGIDGDVFFITHHR